MLIRQGYFIEIVCDTCKASRAELNDGEAFATVKRDGWKFRGANAIGTLHYCPNCTPPGEGKRRKRSGPEKAADRAFSARGETRTGGKPITLVEQGYHAQEPRIVAETKPEPE